MDFIIRNKSIITGKSNLEHIYTYKNFPVFFGCVETDPDQDLRADMSWAICPETGIIQLDKLLPLEIVYQHQHMDGTGHTWQAFYRDFANYIARQQPNRILEIGGAKGDLAEIFIQSTRKTEWTIVEPNPLHPGSDRIHIIPAFFDEQFKHEGTYDAVVFSHTLEHAYDPNEFLKAIADYLKPGGKLIFAYPNLKIWLEKKFLSALNFEHTMFLTDYFVDYLLAKVGFKIIEKNFYLDHSIYYLVEKAQHPEPLTVLDNKYNEYKNIFLDFVEYYQTLVKELNIKIDQFKGEVYVFGGHIFTQYLLECGLREKRISAILDNSQMKQGKRLYGSTLFVKSPNFLKGEKKPAVILKVGPYRDEIYKQLMEINPTTLIFE